MNAEKRYVRHFPVSWELLHRDARTLAGRLLDMGPFKGIVAVTRGGLVPAAVIARELGIHLIETLCIVSYDWQEQKDAGCTVLKGVEGDGAGWLVIDDLVDTGNTAKMVRELLPAAHFAVVYAKPEGLKHVDMHVAEVPQDTWILFPWDAAVQYVQPLVNKK